MDDWDKFGYTDDGDHRPDGRSETNDTSTSSSTDFIIKSTGDDNTQTVFVSETNKRKKKEPTFVTKKAFAITLIFAMLFSAAIGAGAYAIAMSTFGGSTIDKSISTTNYNLAKNTGSPLSVQEIVAKNENSVVAIVTESVSPDS